MACLVIDAADQTIFQNHTDLDLTGYQGYDKALDVYYLAIAYLSTFRNWARPLRRSHRRRCSGTTGSSVWWCSS